jgi:isocitrate dehydrogenase (NAD+)
MSNSIPATLIPGDGIGPEIVDATLAALEAVQAPFVWDRQIAGLGGVQACGDPLPAATLDSIRRTRLALKGPLETPTGGGYRSSNVRLREEFQLYANLRPARTIIPGGRFDKIDLVVVRENLEGLYIGHEHYVKIDSDPHAVAMATGINTRAGSRRLLEYAFEHAVVTGRKKVTIVHKANIMKALTGIFLETGLDLFERKYKGKFELDTVIIDACAMKLVLNPWQFDMLVTTNLFGDILSDLVAGLVGGLGMAPGVYLEPASLRMLALGFSAGLPLLLVLGTLSFRLREAGIDRSTIGYLSWVGLAYGFKWVWAPLVDRCRCRCSRAGWGGGAAGCCCRRP